VGCVRNRDRDTRTLRGAPQAAERIPAQGPIGGVHGEWPDAIEAITALVADPGFRTVVPAVGQNGAEPSGERAWFPLDAATDYWEGEEPPEA
jgi:hypothetical protein